MSRVLPFCVALVLVIAGCSPHTAENGRVQVDKKGGITIVRDTTHVLELPLTRGSAGLDLVALDPSPAYPGFVGLDDPQRGRAFYVWITRLGAKRPANIQRWFDDKVAILSRSSKVVTDRGERFGEHPGRLVDYVHHGDRDTYQRFLGVDAEEHDLELVLVAVIYTAGDPHGSIASVTTEQQKWLDDVLADVREISVVPR